MTQPKTTLYENLAIQPGASRSEIDVAYRQALKGLEVEELAHYSIDAQGSVEFKRQLLEKTYAVLSRPDLKSRYDSGESVPFAAALPESQRKAPGALRSVTKDSLRSALRERQHPKAALTRGESRQLKAFRDNFQPDRLRPIAEVESELLAGKNNIVGIRTSPTVSADAEATHTQPSSEARGQERSELSTQLRNHFVRQAAEKVGDPRDVSETTDVPSQSKATPRQKTPETKRARGLEPGTLRRVRDFADTLEVYTGSNLAELRELAGLTREDMERITKVNQKHLRSIEADDYASLPVRVYVRGFIQEYARALGLDRDRVSSEFLRLYDGHRGTA